jgi:pimeloyl-ACP methyl ester carboxylesterase
LNEPAVEPFTIEVDGIVLTGLRARADRPRASLLALHGGGSRAGYWHGTSHPDQSLLRLAAELGFTAVALDVPGYAASAGSVGHWNLDQRAELVARALPHLITSPTEGSPDAGKSGEEMRDGGSDGVVVVAHSQGSQLALHLTARSRQVIGLEISGTGLETGDANHFVIGSPDRAVRGRQAFETIWGDPSLYPEGALARENTRPAASPAFELVEATTWTERFGVIAAEVPVPVRITVAEHERFWQTATQAGAPHNISLSSAARAYHLHVLAFAEECALWARRDRRLTESTQALTKG